MPYSDKEKQREATRERVRRYREQAKGVTEVGQNVTPVTPKASTDVTPLDPLDWSDRRNYTPAYLRCLEEQGGELTEASRVAMKGHRVEDAEWCRKHSQRGVGVQGQAVGMKQVGKYLVPQGLTVEICQRLLRLSPSDAPLVTMLMRGDNLERMQKVIGILGKEAEHVWLGEHTLKEVGEIIGIAKFQELPQTAPVLQAEVYQAPVYDASKHKAGDWVRKWNPVTGRWELMQVPPLDDEGNPY